MQIPWAHAFESNECTSGRQTDRQTDRHSSKLVVNSVSACKIGACKTDRQTDRQTDNRSSPVYRHMYTYRMGGMHAHARPVIVANRVWPAADMVESDKTDRQTDRQTDTWCSWTWSTDKTLTYSHGQIHTFTYEHPHIHDTCMKTKTHIYVWTLAYIRRLHENKDTHLCMNTRIHTTLAWNQNAMLIWNTWCCNLNIYVYVNTHTYMQTDGHFR